MPPKQQLDKAAWQWAEVTNPEDVTLEHVKIAHRLNLKPCKLEACRRNCKGNPLCLNCIGERTWFGEIDDSSWHDIEDPNDGRRKDGMFVGLKNLGATCYVNTFLQLWYHNPVLKEALYRYIDFDFDKVNGDVTKDGWMPNSIAGHLQVIFALLEKSEREYIDPQNFIDHLGLDTGQQQDAQEFSKLFLNLLEDSLADQPDPSVKNVIQNQFLGKYAYVTTCSKCGNKSQCPSRFYELDLNIRGHKTLEDSIKDFLKEESLDGDNQYMCSFCAKKENAKRAIQLQDLPPVLNLQLLRFVFDKKTGQKKKLNSFIQFPEVLDMSNFLKPPQEKKREYYEADVQIIDLSGEQDEAESTLTEEASAVTSTHTDTCVDSRVYDLTAVLIHRGPTAYSGHYVAHIKDPKTNAWYKFNDEETEKMKGSNLHLGTEDDPQGAQAKKSRTPKGYHTSKNAYMLVYTRRGANCQVLTANSDFKTENLLPQYIKDYVCLDNERFEMWVAEMMMMRDQNIETGKEQQQTVKDVYRNLVPTDNDTSNLEWLSLAWLTMWLEDPNTSKTPTINNKEFLCQHDKLNPNAVVKLKCVNSHGADDLYAKYKGEPRLRVEETFCYTCVQQHCRLLRLKQRMIEDEKLINAALKSNIGEDCTSAYWVGKSSLKSWKKLALQEIEDLEKRSNAVRKSENIKTAEEEEPMDTSENNGSTCNEVAGLGEQKGELGVNNTNKEAAGTTHDNQRGDEGSGDTNNGTEGKTTEDDNSESGNLKFNEDIECEHDNLDPDASYRKLVPESLWLLLKRYFPDCAEYSKETPVCVLCNKQNMEEMEAKDMYKKLASEQKSVLSNLFSDRKRPLHLSVPQEVNVVSSMFVDSWRKFVRDPTRYEPIAEVVNYTLLCEHGGFLYPPGDTPPDLCDHQGKLVYVWPHEWESISRCFIVDTEISVIKVKDEDGIIKIVTLPEVCFHCVEERLVREEKAKYEYKDAVVYIRKVPKDTKIQENNDGKKEDDPDFIQQDGYRSSTEEPPEKFVKMEDGSRRKSQRHRKVRGEKEVNVSSSQTLKDLKLQIMKEFSVPPFDQNLTLFGVSLVNDQASLADLFVSPGSVILLQADEPVEDPMVLQDLMQVSSGPEAGFKGTGLLGKVL